MNATKIQSAANNIIDGALEFMAGKHGLTVDQVVAALLDGDTRAMTQYRTLLESGIDAAVGLHEEEKISLN